MVAVDSHKALLVAGATTFPFGPSLCQSETYSFDAVQLLF